MAVRNGSGERPAVANTILTAALSAIVVMVGAYFAVVRTSVSRADMENYVQTQSPFAHDQSLFNHMEITLNELQVSVARLQLQNQHEQDRIDSLVVAINRLERGERRTG